MDRSGSTIAVLLNDVSHPFSAAVRRAVEDEAHRRGSQVLSGSLGGDPHRERELAATLARRRTDGLILAPAGPDAGYLEAFGRMPVVLVDRTASGPARDTVVATNVAGAAAGVRHLIAYGHRRIAYLGDRRSPTCSIRRSPWSRRTRAGSGGRPPARCSPGSTAAPTRRARSGSRRR